MKFDTYICHILHQLSSESWSLIGKRENGMIRLKIQNATNLVSNKAHSLQSLIASCEGILDREAEAYVKRLAFHFSKKWDKNYSILDKRKISKVYFKISF